MTVGVFYNSVANLQKFQNKAALMDNFRDGVAAHNDTVVSFTGNTLPSPDIKVGFVLGYTLEQNFRRKIIDTLRNQGAYVVFVDSNILHYARKEHEWHRYSMNSVYPNKGIYFFQDLDRSKWNRYSQWHHATLKPWRSNGNHILILCQRAAGWNMFGHNQSEWLDNTVRKLRKYTARPIRVRMHPGDRNRFAEIERIKKIHGGNIELSTVENIKDDLHNAWCSVGYNSTPNVVSAIEGIPVCLTDFEHSWAREIAFKKHADIESPLMPDRSEWIHKIANIHWSNEEVRRGELWAAIKNYIASEQQ